MSFFCGFQLFVFIHQYRGFEFKMSESEIKHVTVALSHPDELNPRRRRRTRKFKDDVESQAGGLAPTGIVDVQGTNTGAQIVMVQKDIPIPTTTTGTSQTAPMAATTQTPSIQTINTPQQNPTVNPIQPTPVLASTVVVGGARPVNPGEKPAAAVHIREKKNTNQTHLPGGSSAGLKIVPHKKRLTNAPVAQTLKKPKFIVSPPPQMTPTSNPKLVSTRGVRGDNEGLLKTVVGGADGQTPGSEPKARKRFTERRIKIEVKPTIKTRKSRKLLIDRIDSMPIQAVRRLLLKKGVLKSKTTVPPEPMMRSMLRDYYLLKQSE
jgi:hypothetical protein